VSDLARSVAFYECLFGAPPAKHHHDYAKFEIDAPPLVFSLAPLSPASYGALNYLGLAVNSIAELEPIASRLEEARFEVSRREVATSGADSIWVCDPDLNEWEIYVAQVNAQSPGFHGNHSAASMGRRSHLRSAAGGPPTRRIWEHRVTDDMPQRIPFDDGALDEVRLTGTFNSHVSDADRPRLLVEAFRVLRPGGEVKVHGLVSSQPLGGRLPSLPGVAALVQRVPTETGPLAELLAAGFVNAQVTKLSESAVFTHGQAEMREIKLTASKPLAPSAAPNAEPVVTYTGPFAEAVDDTGQVYRRGAPVSISARQWEALAASAAGKQFSLTGVQPVPERPGAKG
jgi:hypothetical protein